MNLLTAIIYSILTEKLIVSQQEIQLYLFSKTIHTYIMNAKLHTEVSHPFLKIRIDSIWMSEGKAHESKSLINYNLVSDSFWRLLSFY